MIIYDNVACSSVHHILYRTVIKESTLMLAVRCKDIIHKHLEQHQWYTRYTLLSNSTATLILFLLMIRQVIDNNKKERGKPITSPDEESIKSYTRHYGGTLESVAICGIKKKIFVLYIKENIGRMPTNSFISWHHISVNNDKNTKDHPRVPFGTFCDVNLLLRHNFN